MIETPVLIAGGGPVGLTLAMDLASRGIASVVLEARGEVPPNPRCNTTNARSMEIFRRLGCADAVRRAGLPGDNSTDVVYMTRMNGGELVRFSRPTPDDIRAGALAGISADWPTPELPHYISQLYLEPVLRRCAVEKHKVDLRLGWELLSFTQDKAGVTCLARSPAGGKTETFRCQYLVGADGSGSLVRRDIGARLEGIPALGAACTSFIRAPRLTELYRHHPGWMYRFIGGVIIVAIDGIDEWLIHTQPPAGADPEIFDFEPAMFAAIGEAFEYKTVNVARWTARAMVANKYREGRVFLAGDAAHIWIPMGGFGMNAGIGDGCAIGWLLAGVLKGWLDPKALDAYELERAPIGAAVATQAARWGSDLRPLMLQGAAECELLNHDAAARKALGDRIVEINGSEWENSGMQFGLCYRESPIIAYDGIEAPPFSLEVYKETSSPGARAPHVARGPRKALYDEFGEGFALLRIGSNPPSGQAIIAGAAKRGIPLAVIDAREPEAAVKYEGYSLILVRPDQHIAWRSHGEAENAEALLDRITGKLIAERKIQRYAARRMDVSCGIPQNLLFRRGKWLFSDATAKSIMALDAKSGAVAQRAAFGGTPGGFGFLPDGRMVCASPDDARLMIEEGGAFAVYADLSALVTGRLENLIVDRVGRVYVIAGGETSGRGAILCIDTDRGARVALRGLKGPSGMAITQDGNTLLFAESASGRILQSRFELNGDPRSPRGYIHTDPASAPRGLCIDRSGGLWVCLPGARALERYDRRGEPDARIETPGIIPMICALSADGTELLIGGVEAPGEGGPPHQTLAGSVPRGWIGKADLTPSGLAAAAPQAPAAAASAAAIAGLWDVVIRAPIGDQDVTFDFQPEGGDLYGSVRGRGETNEIIDGRAGGFALSWRGKVSQPVSMEIEFTAMIDGDAISGSAKSPFGATAFSGRRSE